jgi:hypothetical protein
MFIVTVEACKNLRTDTGFGTRLHECFAALQVERRIPVPAYIRLRGHRGTLTHQFARLGGQGLGLRLSQCQTDRAPHATAIARRPKEVGVRNPWKGGPHALQARQWYRRTAYGDTPPRVEGWRVRICPGVRNSRSNCIYASTRSARGPRVLRRRHLGRSTTHAIREAFRRKAQQLILRGWDAGKLLCAPAARP